MHLQLVSWKLCPFVQRVRITLLHKGVDHDVEYIDLNDPPSWFAQASPLGKVPILRVDGEVLFESAVINEFVNDSTGGDMLPDQPLQRAKARAWIEYASEGNGDIYRLAHATEEAAFEAARASLASKLQRVERELGDSEFFLGDEMSLVDTSFAPLLQRLSWIGLDRIIDPAQVPRLAAWSKALLARPEVEASIVPEAQELFEAMMQEAGAYVGGSVAA